MEECIAEVRAWLIGHKLLINDTKTEFLIIGSRQQLTKVTINSINVGESMIMPISFVHNLGTWFDNQMSMSVHIGKVCSKAFRGLYNIRQIRKFLTPDSTKTLIHAFVTSHLDYCNSLLYGIPQYQFNRLQRVLNAAARVVCVVPRFEHISPILKQTFQPSRFTRDCPGLDYVVGPVSRFSSYCPGFCSILILYSSNKAHVTNINEIRLVQYILMKWELLVAPNNC
jgi:hypothetical protein